MPVYLFISAEPVVYCRYLDCELMSYCYYRLY